ncbi:MAG TPA: hypothetical protein VHX16_16220 [Chloroflexota bacterium]|jgi:hypothetical protein|nr:hypothetical protein [Chloroflexota bacterium]
MSVYAIHKICHLVDKDSDFRERVLANPAAALADFRLTDPERAAFLAGDVRTLHDLGAHGFLLGRLPRHGVFGLDRDNYVVRMKGSTRG